MPFPDQTEQEGIAVTLAIKSVDDDIGVKKKDRHSGFNGFWEAPLAFLTQLPNPEGRSRFKLGMVDIIAMHRMRP